MALDNIPTLGPGGFNGNLDKVLVYKNGGSEVACSLLTLTNSALNPAGLYLDPVNQRVGIGTSTPIVPLNVYNSSASVSSVVLVEQDTAAAIGQINQYRKNGSVNLTNGSEIGRLSFGGYFNSTYSPFSQVCSAIYGYYGGTGTDRVGGLRLITWNGGGASTRLQVAPDGKIAIGTTTATAKLQIVGEGSTSATTALLVQNSAGTAAMTVNDDLSTTLGGNILATGFIGDGSNVKFKNTSGTEAGRFYCDSNVLRAYSSGGSVHAYTIFSNGSMTFGASTSEVSSAVMAVASTTKGFLPPVMTTAQKNLIATPTAGLMVYDTDLNRPCFHNGSAWVTL